MQESLLKRNLTMYPCFQHGSVCLQATKKLTLAVMNSIKVLAKVEEASAVHLLLPPDVFYNQLISDKMDMQACIRPSCKLAGHARVARCGGRCCHAASSLRLECVHCN